MIRGYAFNSTADFETIREIKERLCYVAYDIKRDRKLAQETTVVEKEYKLPDNSSIFVGRERFECPECLFNPSLLEMEDDGICEMLFKSLNESPLDCQRALVGNIILSGGTTMFPGLSSRVEKEVKDIYVREKFKGDREGLKRINIVVNDPPRRKHGVFIGASFVGKHTPEQSWISRQAYAE
jgi:actin-related protein 2